MKSAKRYCWLLVVVVIAMALSLATGPLSLAQAAELTLIADLQTDMTVLLNWNDAFEDELGYVIERKTADDELWTEVADTGRQSSSYHDLLVIEEGFVYQYRIKCSHNLSPEISYSNVIEISYPGLFPAAPADLKGEAIFYESAEDRIQLTWSVNETQEHYTEIERRIQGEADWEIIATQPGTQHLWEDMNNLVPGTVYEYRARAVGPGASTAASAYTDIIQVPFGESITAPVTGTTLKFIMGSSTYYIDDVAHQMDMAPHIYNSRCFLPVTYIVSPLGGSAAWDGSQQKVIIDFHGRIIELQVNSNVILVDGVSEQVDPVDPTITPMIVPPGRVVVPVRVVSSAMGCNTTWDQDNNMAIIEYPNPNNPV